MLAVAYRNLAQGPTGLGNNIDRVVRAVVAHAHLRTRRQVQRSAAESLLGDLLECMSGRPSSRWQVTRNQDGKPTLVSSNDQSVIEVSLSHSGSRTLAGITDLGNIGVDLEYRTPRRSISEIAAYAFGPQERRVVESGGPGAFYRIWTLREALAKACGIGFPMLTNGNDYFPEALKPHSWQTAIDGRQWLFSTGDLPDDYAFSVAIALRSPLHDFCGADLTPQVLPMTREPKLRSLWSFVNATPT